MAPILQCRTLSELLNFLSPIMNQNGAPLKVLLSLALGAVLLPLTTPRPDAGDDTLRFYLEKSDLVVLGKITNIPIGVTSEIGVFRYVCEVEVAEVLKGDPALVGETVRTTLSRFEMGKADRNPLIAKGAESILFLKKRKKGSIPAYGSADFWFSVQYPSPRMALALKRLVP